MFEYVEPNSKRWFDITSLINEKWKAIPGYDDLYYVSNYGRILRVQHTKKLKRYTKQGVTYPTKILRHSNNTQGYVNTQLRHLDGTFETLKVHRLVASAFIPNDNGKPQVNHIDGNKGNNRVDNLEWCTNGENGKHAWCTGLRKKRAGADNKFSVKVNQYNLDNTFVREWSCINEITRQMGISHSLITAVCQGKQKTSHGYIWKYKEENNA